MDEIIKTNYAISFDGIEYYLFKADFFTVTGENVSI